MRSYCKSTGMCLRKQLLSYLDAPSPVPSSKLHSCCDLCKSHCGCSECSIKAHTQTAAECSTDSSMPEASVCNDDVSLRMVENLEKLFVSMKKSDKKVPNYDLDGNTLPKTYWKTLFPEERKFLLCHIL